MGNLMAAETLILKVLFIQNHNWIFLNLCLSSVEGLRPPAPAESMFRNWDPVSNTLSIIYNQWGKFINL